MRAGSNETPSSGQGILQISRRTLPTASAMVGSVPNRSTSCVPRKMSPLQTKNIEAPFSTNRSATSDAPSRYRKRSATYLWRMRLKSSPGFRACLRRACTDATTFRTPVPPHLSTPSRPTPDPVATSPGTPSRPAKSPPWKPSRHPARRRAPPARHRPPPCPGTGSSPRPYAPGW